MKPNNRISVLYADSNEDSCLMLKTLLEFSGIDVLSLETACEAFQAAQDNHFDLYLQETSFPDGSGLELCRRLRDLNPQTPIVFYSSAAYESDRQKGIAAGADAYLTKPDSTAVANTIFRLVVGKTKTSQKSAWLK